MNNYIERYDNNDNHEPTSIIGIILISLYFLWVVIGIIAFITSLYCFSRSGTTAEKVLGLVLAIFFGPFYFIFFSMSGYCRK